MRQLTASLLNINEVQLTVDVLEKLAQLSNHDWAVQLILVDNGSDDQAIQDLFSWYLANKDRFAEVLFVASSQNLGAIGGRNLAFRAASAGRILILDNDVILPDHPAWLNVLWQRMSDDPRAAVVGPMLVFANYPEIVQGTGIGLTDRGRVGYLNRARMVQDVPPSLLDVIASPSACWLVRKEAQQAVGLLADEFYPVQYEDVDFCVRLGLAGWKILCDCSVQVKHVENVTTRALENHPFARLTVRQAMRFREKWAHILPEIATITEDKIYWGPIPRVENPEEE